MADYELLGLSDVEKWNQYLQRLPIEQQDIYYTPNYYRLYENNGDGKASCFVFEDKGQLALYPFLLNPVNSLGYNLDKEYYDIQGAYGYNGVISSCYAPDFIDKFYQSFDTYCIDNKIVAEFTRFHPLLNNKLFSERHRTVLFDRKTMYIDLKEDIETIFSKFQTSTRKQIKRCGHKYGLSVKIYKEDSSQLPVFQNIYNEAMDRVGSIPYLYFNDVYFKNLLEQGHTVLFVAYYQEKPIAAITAMYNKVYMHGHLGGALTDYLHTSAYSFLYAEMIKFGLQKGCKFFHAGGGATAYPDDKLLQYKLNFSQTTADFYIGKKIHNEKVYDEIVQQWKQKYPEKENTCRNKVLKYRM